MTFAALASVLGLAFAGIVARRWNRSGRPAFAAWTAGLFVFALAAGFQAVGEANGFNVFVFRGFYLLGGVLGVAYLALGTVFLLAPPRVARVTTLVLVAATVVLAIDAMTVQVDASQLTIPAGILGRAIPESSLLHIGVVVLNILGSVVLIGGSGWSAFRFVRDRAGIDRVVCNVLLTAGALVIAAGFSAAKLAGAQMDALGAYEAAGIALMFAGFLSLGRIGVTRRAITPQVANG